MRQIGFSIHYIEYIQYNARFFSICKRSRAAICKVCNKLRNIINEQNIQNCLQRRERHLGGRFRAGQITRQKHHAGRCRFSAAGGFPRLGRTKYRHDYSGR